MLAQPQIQVNTFGENNFENFKKQLQKRIRQKKRKELYKIKTIEICK